MDFNPLSAAKLAGGRQHELLQCAARLRERDSR